MTELDLRIVDRHSAWPKALEASSLRGLRRFTFAFHSGENQLSVLEALKKPLSSFTSLADLHLLLARSSETLNGVVLELPVVQNLRLDGGLHTLPTFRAPKLVSLRASVATSEISRCVELFSRSPLLTDVDLSNEQYCEKPEAESDDKQLVFAHGSRVCPNLTRLRIGLPARRLLSAIAVANLTALTIACARDESIQGIRFESLTELNLSSGAKLSSIDVIFGSCPILQVLKLDGDFSHSATTATTETEHRERDGDKKESDKDKDKEKDGDKERDIDKDKDQDKDKDKYKEKEKGKDKKKTTFPSLLALSLSLPGVDRANLPKFTSLLARLPKLRQLDIWWSDVPWSTDSADLDKNNEDQAAKWFKGFVAFASNPESRHLQELEGLKFECFRPNVNAQQAIRLIEALPRLQLLSLPVRTDSEQIRQEVRANATVASRAVVVSSATFEALSPFFDDEDRLHCC